MVWFSRYPAITNYILRSQWEPEKKAEQKSGLFECCDQRYPIGTGRSQKKGPLKKLLKQQVGNDQGKTICAVLTLLGDSSESKIISVP